MTKKTKLDEIAINHCGGCRTNYCCRCDNGSFLVKYRTHLYEERVKRYYSPQTKPYTDGSSFVGSHRLQGKDKTVDISLCDVTVAYKPHKLKVLFESGMRDYIQEVKP